MRELKCLGGCCNILTYEYDYSKDSTVILDDVRNKAGVVIYNQDEDSILIVQSRGNLWGIPKGTMEHTEQALECAVREVFEETGLDVSNCKIKNTFIIDQSTYYMIEYQPVYSQITLPRNTDVNSVTWIKVKCMNKMINKGLIRLTKHSKLLFNMLHQYIKNEVSVV
jgi:ADP-ribose pyrophosphatase YjhB (NUDIX family)